jgi:hypothetical protein
LHGPGDWDERSDLFAQTHDILDAAHREQFTPPPEVPGALRQGSLAEAGAHALKIIANQQGLACTGEVLRAIRFVGLACPGALKMGDEGRPFICEIRIDIHSIAF